MEELDTKALGFVLDFGASTRALSPSAVEAQRQRGTSEEVIALVLDAYDRAHRREEGIATIRKELIAQVAAFGDPEALTFAWRTTILFGHQAPAGWASIIPRTVHVHAKAFESDENGIDGTVDIPALIGVLRDGAYDGWISSEWEGHMFAEHDDNFAAVARQQRQLRRLTSAPVEPWTT